MSDVIEGRLVHHLTASVARYAAASRGTGTRRAYASQWGQFVEWCEREGFEPYSGEGTIALHIAAVADGGDHTVSTVRVRLAAIRHEYQIAGVSLNTDDDVLAPVRGGVVRTLGTAPRRKAAPVTLDELRAMVAGRRPLTDAQGARDRMLLLLGFGAALRRSELVALTIGDVQEIPGKGLRVTVRRSKTDQTGVGEDVSVCANPLDAAFCPVAAWRAWMDHRKAASDLVHAAQAYRSKRPLLCAIDKSGRLKAEFLQDRTVALLIKGAAEDAGLDPTLFSGHSLRRGLLTAAADAGADLKDLMRQSRHRDPGVAKGYIDAANAWTNNVSGIVIGKRS